MKGLRQRSCRGNGREHSYGKERETNGVSRGGEPVNPPAIPERYSFGL